MTGLWLIQSLLIWQPIVDIIDGAIRIASNRVSPQLISANSSIKNRWWLALVGFPTMLVLTLDRVANNITQYTHR